MTKKKALKILENLEANSEYICFYPTEIVLDGSFTQEELEAIIFIHKNKLYD